MDHFRKRYLPFGSGAPRVSKRMYKSDKPPKAMGRFRPGIKTSNSGLKEQRIKATAAGMPPAAVARLHSGISEAEPFPSFRCLCHPGKKAPTAKRIDEEDKRIGAVT